MTRHQIHSFPILLAALLTGATACAEPHSDDRFKVTGTLENSRLDEASGIQAGRNGVFYLHNDQKRDVFVIDESGRDLGAFKLDGSKSKDWEDITRIPTDGAPLLVIADTGDNHMKHDEVRLYFFLEPAEGEYGRDHDVTHRLTVKYPDGSHDVEAVAYDSSSQDILLMSKRDRPPRLYRLPLDKALSEEDLEAEFLAEVPTLRPPTSQDLLDSPKRGPWVSQPTGLDISPDGRTAAVLTYRSLYIFTRDQGESWAQAFQKKPVEFLGPPGKHDEAVSFSLDGKSVYVTTERRPAPIYRLDLQP
jgi:hypothetical protein